MLVVGSQTATSHPVLAARLEHRQKLLGQKHIVADLLEHELAARADVLLRPKPGTDLVRLNAVARHILDGGWEDRAFIDARVNGFDAYVVGGARPGRRQASGQRARAGRRSRASLLTRRAARRPAAAALRSANVRRVLVALLTLAYSLGELLEPGDESPAELLRS